MQKVKNKTITAITLILIMTFSISTANTFTVRSQGATSYTPSVSMAISPNPVGVNQATLVTIFILPVPPVTGSFYQNLILKISLPDGTATTLSSINTQAEGSATISYTPTEVGVYTFLITYPGQTFSNGAVFTSGQYNTTLSVQQEPLAPALQGAPLPTSYWTNPINGQNRLWSSISGDWLMRSYNASYTPFDSAGAFNAYSQAPRSSHIMWTKPLAAGGIVGGTSGDTTYYSGLSYQEYLTPPLIMDGKLYYNTHYGGLLPSSYTGFVCVDLRTGQELYQNPQYTISYGMEYNLETGNQAGVVGPYLWALSTELSGATTWNLLDAFTGDLVQSFTNGTTGTVIMGSNGELNVYMLNTAAGTLSMWNSTKAFMAAGTIADYLNYGGTVFDWLPHSGNYSWTAGIQWTQVVPVIFAPSPFGLAPLFIFGVTDNILLAGTFFGNSTNSVEAGYSLTTGQQLWENTHDIYYPDRAVGEGIYTCFNPNTRTWTAFNANTGNKLWTSSPYSNPWDTYLGTGETGTIAYGMLYAGTYGGMYAINITTGNIAWSFSSGNSGLNTPYGSWPFFYGADVADGVVFVACGEHSPTQPLEEGENVFAIDAYTGNELWNISGYMPLQALADGYLIGYSAYDNQIYSFGQGPSATTVQAPLTVITAGNKVIIQGTVTDVSAGTKQNQQATNFPNGVPVASDASMSTWMEYVYEQQPCPANFTGVTVTLTAIDPNSNYITLGTATTDTNGLFHYTWTTPNVPGDYTIYAIFAGTNGYWSSSSETAMTVTEATQATAAPTSAQTSMADTYLLPGIIGIIVAIAVVGIVLAFLVTKKRPQISQTKPIFPLF